MERRSEELSARMVELSLEAETDLKIVEVMLKEKALSVPALKMKWIKIGYEEERYLKKLKEAKEQLVSNFVIDMAKKGVPNIKCQRDAKNDPSVMVLIREMSEQLDVVRFVEDINGVWKTFGFDIKSCVDITKMENM